MTFAELKEKYAELDRAADAENLIFIKNLVLTESGRVTLNLVSFTEENNCCSGSFPIANDRTPEQMEQIIKALL